MKLFWLHRESVYPTEKGKKWFHHTYSFENGPSFSEKVLFWHENGTTVSKRDYFSSSSAEKVPLSVAVTQLRVIVVLCSAPSLLRPAHQHHSFHGRLHSDAHLSINSKPQASES